jgi:hypothetical protein
MVASRESAILAKRIFAATLERFVPVASPMVV